MDQKIVSQTSTAVKICGITQVSQAIDIASLGVDAIGIIGVNHSKRYVMEEMRIKIFHSLKIFSKELKRVWVIADMPEIEIEKGILCEGPPSVIQLHGSESIEKCLYLKKKFPNIIWWKAFRIKSKEDIKNAKNFENIIDGILLDSWNKNTLGGTGSSIPLELIKGLEFKVPLWIAGGVTANIAMRIINTVNPYGLDASSKLEIIPGIKDLEKVKSLLKVVRKNKIF